MSTTWKERLPDRSATPLVMGILNVTPDSFSDGGLFLNPESALARADAMVAEGAAIIDVGPESTRPGSAFVAADVQIARAVPVIHAIRQRYTDIGISIDTRLAQVAAAAIEAGADIINDTSALEDDPSMADLAARRGAFVVLMHRRGTPADMQRDDGPQYDDVVADVADYLERRVAFAQSRGISPHRLIVDPGLGFGKRVEHNLLLMRHLDRLASVTVPVVVGASRKRFIGSVLGIDEPADRLAGSLACAVWAALAGARIIRAHDVAPTVEALAMLAAVAPPAGPGGRDSAYDAKRV